MAMPLCQCGHAWGDHAMPPHMDYDIDNGERWCYADQDRCPCKRYVVDLMDALKRALCPDGTARCATSGSLCGRVSALIVEGRGISLLVNVTINGVVTYTIRVDKQPRKSGYLIRQTDISESK